MTEHPDRRRHRLPLHHYEEADRAFSVTVGTSPRRPIFEDLAFGQTCVDLLRALHDVHRVPVHAYCLMPDHVHLLLGATTTLSLVRFMQRWKSLCYQARRREGDLERFWQRGHFDHAVRKSEDLTRVAEYILQNPGRAGLVEDFRAYPLCGSLEWRVR